MQYSGNSVIFQIGKETTYGGGATATHQVAISSESLKAIYNKKSEGLATGGRGEGRVQTMGQRASGSVSTLMRPDMGLFLKLLCGVEAVTGTGPYTHTYTASAGNLLRPSANLIVDRGVAVYSYAGSKINQMSLSASAGDFANVTFDFNGKSESAGTKATLTPSALKAFRFAGGSVKVAGTSVGDVKSIDFTWNNNDDVETQTTSTGDNYEEPQHGTRQITGSFGMIWNSNAKTLIDSYYKTDSTFSLELNFVSDEMTEDDDETPYSMTITIPCCQVPESSAGNMGSPTEFLSASINYNAVDNLDDELCSIVLINDDSEAY